MTITLEDYIDDSGFIDVPRIIEDGKINALFPGLLVDVDQIRKTDFPLLDSTRRVYLDSTATSQEPDSVKDRMHQFRKERLRGSNHSKNSAEARSAQEAYLHAKQSLSDLFTASQYHLAFTSGTTSSSNAIATRFRFSPHDLVLFTAGEHNSQVITARNFASAAGSDIQFVEVNKEGILDLNHLETIIKSSRKRRFLMNLVHSSNVSGVVNPVTDVKKILGPRGVIYLDAAQSAGHIPMDLDSLDVDFVGMSAHKMYGPMGIGALFVNKRSQGYLTDRVSGGSAVITNSRLRFIPSSSPDRFEPGTQNLEGAVEWGMAAEYLAKLGMDKIHGHDLALGKYFVDELAKIPGVTVYGPKTVDDDRLAVVAFNVGRSVLERNYGDVARKLDAKGVSVRDGCFCAHVLIPKLMGLPNEWHEERTQEMLQGVTSADKPLLGTVRASFAFYNNLNDAYQAVQAIRTIANEIMN